nr:immunoglobulin heavy chain junction region [Macaca mulatta]MOV51087.1 immunoglobulin heavy chain junction region [Macaca mulatta]MOV51288.1 immunoglobulin heavy chain junction region [Macaca mulatta]MOV51350.1 immunoglobulin heavy chain junction region [Macaca mulatta]MOV53046.1 immunoglobulin heavy chain junction region [Macaca mulatta]
CTRVQSNHDYW